MPAYRSFSYVLFDEFCNQDHLWKEGSDCPTRILSGTSKHVNWMKKVTPGGFLHPVVEYLTVKVARS